MSSFANTFHQELLVDGYVRRQTHKFISIDILNLIMLFCNEAFKWCFTGNAWTRFLNTRNGHAIYGPTFSVNEIKFKCSVCPNGWAQHESNQVKFWLEIDDIPSNMSTVWLYYEIYCKETASAWKDCLRITKGSIGHGTAWKQKLKLSKCKSLNTKSITFYYFVEIIKIDYIGSHTKTYNKINNTQTMKQVIANKISLPSVEISDRFKYEWIAGKMEENEKKIYLSRNFDNGCWYLFCDLIYVDKYAIADGLMTKFYVGLKLIRLPLNVEEILVRYTLKCDYEETKGSRVLRLKELKTRQIAHTFELQSKSVYKYLPITVTIEIVKRDNY